MNAEELHELRLKVVADRIRQLRKDAGYTSYENFAVQHGLDRKHYWRMESGQNVSLRSLFKILDIHKMTIQNFFQGLDFPEKL